MDSIYRSGNEVCTLPKSIEIVGLMASRTKNIMHARNLFDRACAILPRVDKFWYKRVHMEELMQQFSGARHVFERCKSKIF